MLPMVVAPYTSAPALPSGGDRNIKQGEVGDVTVGQHRPSRVGKDRDAVMWLVVTIGGRVQHRTSRVGADRNLQRISRDEDIHLRHRPFRVDVDRNGENNIRGAKAATDPHRPIRVGEDRNANWSADYRYRWSLQHRALPGR
jgi:hypothetical protein